ncbi:MAG TPA: tRNA 2-selenouridine(34) synthase MnmH [Ramlibacter sp.]|nr:tRNA 2-selenouridine(34) synthase MnmH [Ramlibacter sp.]
MSVQSIAAADAIAQLSQFDSIVDARTEDEFAEDHIPGALNWPSLNNEERKEVGTIYKQVSPFEAKKRGAMLVSANIARHIGEHVIGQPRGWKPVIYCWRGGKRSGSLALVLDQIGFRVHVIEGGYKAFRAAILEDIPQLAQRLTYRVICGPTGSGKTRLLHALRDAGAQVLDLEGLANHRSSVLGIIPGVAQPTQKAYDTLVWDALRKFDPARLVFVESESKKVGNVAVPEALIAMMRASDCIRIELAEKERVALLMEDYDFFVKDRALFSDRLSALAELRGRAVIADWIAKVAAGDIETVVRELLLKHYDPGYSSSIQRNFKRFAEAPSVTLADRSPAAMKKAAALIARD